MASGYRIDVEHRLVVIWLEGPVVAGEVIEGRTRLSEDPDFDPGFDQLIDMSGAEATALTAVRLRQLARGSIFEAGVRRALVAPADLAFGLSRMYQVLAEESLRQETRVFRTLGEALEWLEAPPHVAGRASSPDDGPAGG